MCMQKSAVCSWHSWNWNGDEIVARPIIPASRTIPGTRRRYSIDIREFLTTVKNAVVGEALAGILHRLPQDEQSRFRSHAPGSFDFRVDKVVEFVATLRYRPAANVVKGCPDAWLFPDETLTQGGGDCEDLAFLLAALLAAAGVSPYCLRVALGELQIQPPSGPMVPHDHCWVMYLNERGVWEVLEPTALVARGAAKTGRRPSRKRAHPTTYVPHFVFNTDHLWRIRSPDTRARSALGDYCLDRRFWDRFDPAFAAGIHDTIFDRALAGLVPDRGLATIKRMSLWLDANVATYDPRDHFDNGYIVEGWKRVQQGLDDFHADNSDWDSFGAAGHAIGDFYAHTSYVHFAVLQDPTAPDGQAVPYSPGVELVAPPAYTAAPPDASLPAFDLTSTAFSMNPNYWEGSKEDAAAQWAGQLISGRYAQKYDPKATLFEGGTSIPFSLSSAPGFKERGALPHHNEIAVDEPAMSRLHRLYRAAGRGAGDRQVFANQFRWRENTAMQHIRQAFQQNWNG